MIRSQLIRLGRTRTLFPSTSYSITHLRCFSNVSGRTSPAIAFDIDGVLLRGSQLLPGATKVIQQLVKVPSIPFVFLTNGGGMTRDDKAEHLSSLFDCNILPDRVILSHTPMVVLSQRHENHLVAVIGRFKGSGNETSNRSRKDETVRRVMQELELPSYITIKEIAAALPDLVPHVKEANLGRESMHPLFAVEGSRANALRKIGAILVLHDPDEWYSNLQIALDILTANLSQQKSSSKYSHPPIYFSNPDFLFSSRHESPRLAQGAFRTALAALYQEYTGLPLECTMFGKPNTVQYKYAESLLARQASELGYQSVHQIYMIGDNPAADIRGANRAGDLWYSILVRSGTIGPSTLPEDQPKIVVDGVKDAIAHLSHREQYSRRF